MSDTDKSKGRAHSLWVPATTEEERRKNCVPGVKGQAARDSPGRGKSGAQLEPRSMAPKLWWVPEAPKNLMGFWATSWALQGTLVSHQTL